MVGLMVVWSADWKVERKVEKKVAWLVVLKVESSDDS